MRKYLVERTLKTTIEAEDAKEAWEKAMELQAKDFTEEETEIYVKLPRAVKGHG